MRNAKITICLAVVCVLTAIDFASAKLIRGIDIDFVTIGNANNAGDTRAGVNPYGCGAVGYNYRIGKYEVTNAQWNAFTAAAGAPTGNNNGYNLPAYFTGAQQPTNDVSWYEAIQFCNYLTSGDKSKGAYLFSGNNTNPGYFSGVDRTAAQTTYGAIYVLPTEDEWYKAAYHKNDGVTGNYWVYPTESNDVPSNDLINPDPGNNANFYLQGYTIGAPDYLTNVGEFENSASAYGTFDQGGNVWELTERFDVVRGGGYEDISADSDPGYCLRSGKYWQQYREAIEVGFRVAEIPEPASAAIMTLAGLFIALKRKQR